MISRLDAGSQQFLNEIAYLNRRLEKAQRELSSGRRLTQVSDDPDQIGVLLNTRAALEFNTQIKENLSRIQTEAGSAESAIAGAVKVMEHARVLAAQGGTATTTAAQRATLALEVASSIEQIVTFASATVEGRFLFSGDSDGTAAYSVDFSLASPLSAYQGSAATRQVLLPSGARLNAARTAQEVFHSANSTEDVLGSLLQLRDALLNNDQTAILAASDQIQSAGEYLNAQHAFYGSFQSQINDAVDQAYKVDARLKIQIASIEDADIAAAALEISNAKLQQNAALEARAAQPRKSLFDYLG